MYPSSKPGQIEWVCLFGGTLWVPWLLVGSTGHPREFPSVGLLAVFTAGIRRIRLNFNRHLLDVCSRLGLFRETQGGCHRLDYGV